MKSKTVGGHHLESMIVMSFRYSLDIGNDPREMIVILTAYSSSVRKPLLEQMARDCRRRHSETSDVSMKWEPYAALCDRLAEAAR